MIWSAALQTDPRQQQQHAYCVHRARGMYLNVTSGQNRLSIIACLSLLMRLVRNVYDEIFVCYSKSDWSESK